MKYGIRLTGTERDLATLHTLADARPELVVAPWTVLSPAAPSRCALTSARLDLSIAQGLWAKGVDVVRVTVDGDALLLAPLRGEGEVERRAPYAAREASSLVEAAPVVRLRGDPAADEVIFRVALDGDGAQRALERLLALKRDDFSIAEVLSKEDGARVILLRVPAPPMYLLMRSREEPVEGVTAYARAGDGNLWVEWGYAHPLAHVVARHLKGGDRAAFVDRAGRWRFDAGPLPWRSVYDALVPTFAAPRVDFAAAQGETRFTVRLRLGPAAMNEPELWLLDPEQLLALEPLIESLTQEEVARFTVARTTGSGGSGGTRYVLQEIVRPGVSRMGVRVSDLAGSAGFARAQGTDNLYLPVGRQLLPRMRRDELRSLLELDRARLVVVREDADGPEVVLVRTADEAPLSRWVDYVATDRRMELERLDEEAVFDWPELAVERAARPKERPGDKPSRADNAPPPRARKPEPKRAAEEPEIPVEVDDESAADAALREEIRALEKVVAEGGCDEAATWGSLGALKGRAQELDDAAACLEAAMFYGDATAEMAAALAAHRARLMGATGSRDELLALVTRPRLSPGEAAFLGARVVELALRGESLVDDTFYQQAERAFTDPETPVSRRLAWTVARTLHRRTGDRLGVTRARERVLGGMNDRGLSDSVDMPRFVRFALALEAGDASGDERARGEQLTALERLWSVAQKDFVRELTPLGAYLRLIFAVGFARLGATARGRDLVEPVEAEEGVHEPPNRVLFKLYRARYAHVVTQGDAEAWKAEAEGLVAAIKEPRVRDRVEWLRTRSEWLRTRAAEDLGPTLKAAVERTLAEVEASPERAGAALAGLLDGDLYAYEMRAAVDRALRAALRSGNDDHLADVLRVTSGRFQRINIAGHRAGVIGSCIKAAAALGEGETVDRLLDEVVALTLAPDAPQPRDLLLAVQPGLAALRRLGVGASARRFLEALEPVAQRGQREGVKLRAALADGFLQMRDVERADQLIAQCLDDTLDGSLDHVGRYDAGVAVLASLRHWPMAARAPRCERVLAGLDRFTDAFTASTYKLYETHKVLIAERVVDAVADDVTFRGDRVRAFLDEEEQVIRRRILADWREACGR